METQNRPSAEKTTAIETVDQTSLPHDTPSKFQALLHRRSVWLVLLLVAALFAFGYHWAFGKPEVRYNTAVVERGNIESTVVAAGIVQPFKYVDVGAQTSGVLKSLKVIRGDQVKKDQLIAEIDPVLADTALIAANAEVENMIAQRSVKQAQLVLAKVQRDRNEKLFALGDGSVSTSDRDTTRANYDIALAEVASLSTQIMQATAAVETA